MNMSRNDEDTDRVELYVRSLCPQGMHGSQETVIERLERLDEADVLSQFEVRVWGHQVALSTASSRTEAGENALARYGLFKQWADEHDRSINSFFDVRTVESELLDERYTAVVFPALTLAEFRGDELVHMAPSSDGEEISTVGDRLDALEARAKRATEPDRPAAAAEDR